MRFIWFALLLVILGACSGSQKIHVASPVWQDQIIYFLMTDRFNDGDKSNNDQGANVYDPHEEGFYSGGDLQGVIDKVDYIKNLGATAVWITPPVANVWYSSSIGNTGYHGYWARNFREVDAHYGNLETYKALSHSLHDRDMYMIQDIVINHVGRFFQYDGAYDPQNTAENFKLTTGNLPTDAPTQAPYHMNDRNNPAHVAADIYRWTPEIFDFYDQNQEFTYQLSGLNDINTSNPLVRKSMKETYQYWIDAVGVDAFRLDSAKYLEHDFLHDFLYAKDGIKHAAAKTGRHSFPVFGEIFETSPPMNDQGERKIASFQGTDDRPELPSIIAMPLYEEMTRVFAGGRPTSQLTYRLKKQMAAYADPYIVLNFVDNHDVQRFLQKGSLAGFKQALAMIMTIPGIPVIYQGDEQGLTETRQAMFAGGYGSTEDKFDPKSDLYRFIQKMAAVRTNHKVLSRGTIAFLDDNATGPGVLAYKRRYEGTTALVLFNSAEHTTLLGNLETGLMPGQKLTLLAGENFNRDLQLDNTGKLTLEIPARAIMVLLAAAPPEDIDLVGENPHILVDQNITGQALARATGISGTISSPDSPLLLVIDGNLDNAVSLQSDHLGRWKAVIPAEDLGLLNHTMAVYSRSLGAVSARQSYQTNVVQPQIEMTLHDALGDDVGLAGKYKAPTSPDFYGQMDIEQVTIKAGGRNLQLTLKMKTLKSHWLAPNGFDHVMFSIFFDFPDVEGATSLPLLYARTPSGFSWNMGHKLFGWGNQLYGMRGATPLKPGRNLAVAPDFTVDEDTRTVTITYSGAGMGLSNWQGVKVYITTWDTTGGEGSYRAISPAGGPWAFGGGEADAPHILDDLPPILITK